MANRIVDSVPAWALGPRSPNSKFDAGRITAGIPLVHNRLIAIQSLSGKLGLSGDDALRSSAHVLHEVRTTTRKYRCHNAPTAISFTELKTGIKAGKFPRWVAMTAPQFGFKGAERGGMISKVPADREMARALHMEAITWSQELAQAGLGAGINIWWPAWTSRKVDDPTDPPISFDEAWDLMLKFWVDVLKTTGGYMWLEWKPGDPGVDYLMTIDLAIKFCQAVNTELGRFAMFINNEFAHILLQGISVADGVQRTVDAGLFNKFVHGNSGQKTAVDIQQLLAAGTRPEDIMIGTDHDWLVGHGGKENWDDQQKAIGIMDKAEPIIVWFEHDVNPAGLNPLVVFEQSIFNRRQMLENVRSVSPAGAV
ncbi:MAG: hypothetical protein NTY04_00525 [Candidatus Staskawiczbacteria bacterium]|nr:hypothetical protein [Candidatus Staskawiczbacteria bacterium]